MLIGKEVAAALGVDTSARGDGDRVTLEVDAFGRGRGQHQILLTQGVNPVQPALHPSERNQAASSGIGGDAAGGETQRLAGLEIDLTQGRAQRARLNDVRRFQRQLAPGRERRRTAGIRGRRPGHSQGGIRVTLDGHAKIGQGRGIELLRSQSQVAAREELAEKIPLLLVDPDTDQTHVTGTAQIGRAKALGGGGADQVNQASVGRECALALGWRDLAGPCLRGSQGDVGRLQIDGTGTLGRGIPAQHRGIQGDASIRRQLDITGEFHLIRRLEGQRGKPAAAKTTGREESPAIFQLRDIGALSGHGATSIALRQRNDAGHAGERQLSGNDLIRLIARKGIEFNPQITAGRTRTATGGLQVAHDLHALGGPELDLAAIGSDQLLAACLGQIGRLDGEIQVIGGTGHVQQRARLGLDEATVGVNGDLAAIQHLALIAADGILIDATGAADVDSRGRAEPDALIGQETGIGQRGRGDVQVDLTRLGGQGAIHENAAIRTDRKLAADTGAEFRALADADRGGFAPEADLLRQFKGQVTSRLDQVRQGFDAAEQAQILAGFSARGAGIENAILDADLDPGVVGHRQARFIRTDRVTLETTLGKEFTAQPQRLGLILANRLGGLVADDDPIRRQGQRAALPPGDGVTRHLSAQRDIRSIDRSRHDRDRPGIAGRDGSIQPPMRGATDIDETARTEIDITLGLDRYLAAIDADEARVELVFPVGNRRTIIVPETAGIDHAGFAQPNVTGNAVVTADKMGLEFNIAGSNNDVAIEVDFTPLERHLATRRQLNGLTRLNRNGSIGIDRQRVQS